MVLKCSFFIIWFYTLYKRLDYWVFIKNMHNRRAPPRLFSSNEYRKQREFHANLSGGKPFLFCVNEQICIRFRTFSKRTNIEWNLIFFYFCKYIYIYIIYVNETRKTVVSFFLFFFSCHPKISKTCWGCLKESLSYFPPSVYTYNDTSWKTWTATHPLDVFITVVCVV